MKYEIVEVEANFFKKGQLVNKTDLIDLLFDENYEDFTTKYKQNKDGKIKPNYNLVINCDKIGFRFRYVGVSNNSITACDYLINNTVIDIFKEEYNIFVEIAEKQKMEGLKKCSYIDVLKFLVVYEYKCYKSFNGETTEYNEDFNFIGEFNDVFKLKQL